MNKAREKAVRPKKCEKVLPLNASWEDFFNQSVNIFFLRKY